MTATATGSLATEMVSIDALRPDPANPRSISPAELDALERSIRTFGFVQPVIARREDGVVIGGHQRLVAARRLGLASVPVVWLDLPPEAARLLGLALNRISGTWDEQLLARLLAELGTTPGVDVGLSGFGPDEVSDLLRSLAAREKREQPESFDLDTALEEARRSGRAEPGSLWALGEHRLLSGDSTRPEDVERLLAGGRADMAFTDSPYHVALGDHGGRGRGARRRRPIANDDLAPAAFEAFVRGWAGTLLGSVDGAVYICMSSKEWPLLCAVLAEAGGHWSDTIIWSKDRFTLGRADYQRSYEPIWYGWREGATHHWCGDRDQGDVWQIDRPSDSPLHPTMKPLALMERAIANSSRPGALVLDIFAGSGSTLIAAERTGRRCAALELDPLYVDVTIARWERFAGGRAVRIDG
jgi:DNA modification methylase